MNTISNFFSEWFAQLHSTFIETGYWKFIFTGLGNTLLITLGALAIGFVLGTAVAICKHVASRNRKFKVLDIICNIYLGLIRGTPVTVQLMIMFFIIFASAKEGIGVAILTFGINSGAYTAEVIRSGITAIDRGQEEAGRSLGLSSAQTMISIILPQAIKNILPAIGNEMIALLKETSVAGYVSVRDLTKMGNIIQTQTYDAFNPILLVAAIYLIMVLGLTKLLSVLERRLKKSDRS